jgi:hypothetical protein
MSFTNPAPNGGAYVTGDLIDEAEINYWCSILPDCVDGAGGGTYTLSAPLIFAGDVVEVDDLVVNDDLIVGDDALISGDLIVTNALTVAGAAVFNGNVTIGDNPIVDTLTVESPATFNDTVVVDSTFIANSASFLSGNVTLGDTAVNTIDLKGILSPGTTGRILHNGFTLPNTDDSVNIQRYRFLVIPATVSAERTYTTTSAAPADGDWFVVQNHDSINHNLAGLLSTIILPNTGKMIMRISGSWVVVMAWAG